MKQLLIILFTTIILHSPFSILNSHAATIQLTASGQNKCYDPTGNTTNEIPCAGTGQDGEQKAGASWNEATRFSSNGNGTITDSLTGLVWLQNANCFGAKVWADALITANNLATGSCGLLDGSSAGQWRLPNYKELNSLFNRGQVNNSAWLTTKRFSNVQAAFYWSSSTSAKATFAAWGVDMGVDVYGGVTQEIAKMLSNAYGLPICVWPVRNGP